MSLSAGLLSTWSLPRAQVWSSCLLPHPEHNAWPVTSTLRIHRSVWASGLQLSGECPSLSTVGSVLGLVLRKFSPWVFEQPVFSAQHCVNHWRGSGQLMKPGPYLQEA